MKQRDLVVAEASRWLGTPYHHHGRLQGVGVDCAMLLVEVFERCGLVPRLDVGFYPRDWHLHRSEELYLGWMERAGAHPVQTPAPGDVGLWRFGRTFSHSGIVVSDAEAVHAYIDRGVIRTRIDEPPLQGRAVRWWSLCRE